MKKPILVNLSGRAVAVIYDALVDYVAKYGSTLEPDDEDIHVAKQLISELELE